MNIFSNATSAIVDSVSSLRKGKPQSNQLWTSTRLMLAEKRSDKHPDHILHCASSASKKRRHRLKTSAPESETNSTWVKHLRLNQSHSGTRDRMRPLLERHRASAKQWPCKNLLHNYCGLRSVWDSRRWIPLETHTPENQLQRPYTAPSVNTILDVRSCLKAKSDPNAWCKSLKTHS